MPDAMLSAYVLLTMSVPLVGVALIVPVVSAIDVMSVLAPEAAAPRFVRAAAALATSEKLLATWNTAEEASVATDPRPRFALAAVAERPDVAGFRALAQGTKSTQGFPPARLPTGNCRWFPGLNRREAKIDAGIGEG